MATHWHRPVRMVLLETLNELVRRHAAAVSAWLGRAQGRRLLIDTLQTLISTEARMVANPQAGVVVSGGSFSTWAVAEATKLPPVGPPGAPPPEAAEENVRTSGGRGVAKSA